MKVKTNLEKDTKDNRYSFNSYYYNTESLLEQRRKEVREIKRRFAI